MVKIFEIAADIGLNADKFNKGIQDAEGKMSKFADVMGGIGSGIAKLGGIAATGLAAGTAAFATLSVHAIKLGGDLEQNIGGAQAVFKEFSQTVIEKGAGAFEKMGMAQSDYLANINKFGALLQGAGFAIEESMTTASDVMQRAADVASIMGVDTASAMEAVSAAAKGNFTMMDNLGVAMNATTIEAYAMSKGMNTSWNEMDNATKSALAFEMFMEKTAYAAGNYAKENDTLAGSLGTAKAAWDNFLTGAGNVDQLVGAFSNASSVIVDNVIELTPRLAKGLVELVDKLTPQIPGILKAVLPSLIDGAKSLVSGLVTALPAIVSAVSEVIPDIIDAIFTMMPLLLDAGIQILSQLALGIAEALPELIPAAIETLLALVDVLLDNIDLLIDAAIALMLGLTEGLIAALPVLIERLPEIVEKIVTTLIENAPLLLDAAIQIIMALAQGFIDNLPEILAAAGEIVMTILNKIGELPGKIWNAIISAVDKILEWGKRMIDTGRSKITEMVNTIKTKAEEIPGKIWNAITGAIDKIIQWGSDIVNTAKDQIGKMVKAVYDKAMELKDKLFEAAGNVIEGFWNGINNAKDWLLGKISGFFGGVVSSIKEFFGIHSPSRLMAGIGGFITQGLGNGILAAADYVYSAIDTINDYISTGIDDISAGINFDTKLASSLATAPNQFGGFGGTFAPVIQNYGVENAGQSTYEAMQRMRVGLI